MKFDCKEISILNQESVLQIDFSENHDLGEATEGMSINEIIESTGKYLLLQRSYSEDDFDTVNYYIETHDEEIWGDLEDYADFEMLLSQNKFELKLPNNKIEISINPTDLEFSELKKYLPDFTHLMGKLTIIG